jgi:hypothetical protein
VVQEQRFQLLTDRGQGLLLTLSHTAPVPISTPEFGRALYLVPRATGGACMFWYSPCAVCDQVPYKA